MKRLPILGLLLFGPCVLSILWLSDATIRSTAAQPPAGKEQSSVDFAKDVLPFLNKNCYECHGHGKKKGEMSLDRFQSQEDVLKDRATWDTIQSMIRTGQMPPKERPKPAAEEVAKVLANIHVVMNSLDCTRGRNVGRVTLHRLNRAEYNNTVRDLVGVDFKPAADFPIDDVGYGFDNIGDVLTVSPLLMEKYLNAAEEILDKAITILEPVKASKSRLSNFKKTAAGGNVKGQGDFITAKGEIWSETNFEAGDYNFRVEVAAEQAGDQPVKTTLWYGEKEVLKDFEVKALPTKPMLMQGRYRITKSGTERVYVSLNNPFKEPEAPPPEKKDATADKDKQAQKQDKQAPAPVKQARKERKLFVKSIEVEGPFDPPPPPLPEATKKFLAHDEGLAPREAARQIVGRFARRAFRRPVTPEEVENLLKLYDKADKAGERFENCIRLAVYRVLCSPHFLFRIELDPPDAKPGTSYVIDEFSLASRLSYFLWSSMPDEELLDLAGKGQLRKNLESQVKRMVQDPKSAAFVQNFAGQWLALRNLASSNPDPKVFPQFNDELRASMYRETEMFFEAVLREDRSIFDFIDGDFTFVNETLAKHYGIEGVKGKKFVRIKVPPNRAGVMTQASILTMTSEAGRTSPVKRGKWVLEQILNTPPPPPPPDVPPLEDEGRELKGSLRQIMEMHRANTICASCHQRMDPIGFGFENFDAVGVWRVKDGKFDVDPSGVLPGGQSFKGPVELIAILKSKKDLFSRCLSEKVLTYAMGRGVEFYDKCAIDAIVNALDANEYKISTLLLEVVKSEPFQMRTAAQAKK